MSPLPVAGALHIGFGQGSAVGVGEDIPALAVVVADGKCLIFGELVATSGEYLDSSRGVLTIELPTAQFGFAQVVKERTYGNRILGEIRVISLHQFVYLERVRNKPTTLLMMCVTTRCGIVACLEVLDELVSSWAVDSRQQINYSFHLSIGSKV